MVTTARSRTGQQLEAAALAATPNLWRDILLLRPPLTGFKAYNL
jgi:hypothetical protein